MAAGVQLTTDAARGAAALASQGKAVRCWVSWKGGTRFCVLESLEDADAGQAWLRDENTGKRSLVPVSRIQTAQATQQTCLVALSNAQVKPGETLGERMGRQASESPDVINARLWAARQLTLNRGARRDVAGRFAGHHCEAAGRR